MPEGKPDWMMAALFWGKHTSNWMKIRKGQRKFRKGNPVGKKSNHDDPAEEATQLLKECSRTG